MAPTPGGNRPLLEQDTLRYTGRDPPGKSGQRVSRSGGKRRSEEKVEKRKTKQLWKGSPLGVRPGRTGGAKGKEAWKKG